MSVIPLFGYEATRDLESLSLNVIYAHSISCRFHRLTIVLTIVRQLWFTDSWRTNRAYLLSTKAIYL